MNLIRNPGPESETISLTDVKNQLRITATDDDDALRVFIAGIREKTETYLGRTLVTTPWQLKLDSFDSEINLTMGPVQSITSISYVDTNGDNQSFTDFQFDRSGRLKPSYGNSWPSTRDQYDAVTINYVAGETHAGNVKADIKLAMLLWIGDCDLNREDSAPISITPVPNGAKDILNMYRNWQL